MRTRRETVEHPFGSLKMRMGATHFLCKTLPKVATERVRDAILALEAISVAELAAALHAD